MMWLGQLVSRLMMRRRIYSDLSEEIQQHLAEKAEALMADGMSRNEAEQAAKRGFGNVARMEERGRETWMWPLMESLWADMRFAARQLAKNYGFALTTILTLALGIFVLLRAASLHTGRRDWIRITRCANSERVDQCALR